MRALKSVLVMAGRLKRAHPDLQEDIVLIRAMRDSNIPKFLQSDVELFEDIISDLFPNVHLPDQARRHSQGCSSKSLFLFQSYGELESTIRAVLSENKLKASDVVVNKSLQLFETLHVRFGVMLVGPAGRGKTTCYKTLASALTQLKSTGNTHFRETHVSVLNPKSVTMGELYGEYSPLTNEWTDGLASTLIRAAVNDTSPDFKWIVFDGPVDAIWVENMNTGIHLLQHTAANRLLQYWMII